MHEYTGTCPKCGHDRHYIVNASMPTVNECVKCSYLWNPDNVRVPQLNDFNETRLAPIARWLPA